MREIWVVRVENWREYDVIVVRGMNWDKHSGYDLRKIYFLTSRVDAPFKENETNSILKELHKVCSWVRKGVREERCHLM